MSRMYLIAGDDGTRVVRPEERLTAQSLIYHSEGWWLYMVVVDTAMSV